MTADAAAVLPNPDTCPHSWTAEEFLGKTVTGTETHTPNNGQTCTMTYYYKSYKVVCRTCGTNLGTRREYGTSHSVTHP